jgi:small subunit ribosomal protein S6
MRRYETIFIVRPTTAEDDITSIIEKVNSIIEGDGGSFIRVDKWGLKKLAYLIKKESQGYYVYVDYAGIPASVAEMERIFRIDDRILKYLTVKLADFCDPEAIKEQLAQEEQADESSTETEETAEASAAVKETVEVIAEVEETAEVTDATEALPEVETSDVAEEEKAE